MSDALSTAVGGINQAVARTTQVAADIVNASSTGGNIDENMIQLMVEKNNVAANVAVIKAARKMDQALLDITV